MAKRNSFEADLDCPHCHTRQHFSFEADIGVLDYSTYLPGDLVIKTVPLKPTPRAPIGPAVDVDWDRPFWALGLATCPHCHREVNARVIIRARRYLEAIPTTEKLDLFAWGYVEP